MLPPVSARSGFGPRGPLFAVAADNTSLYLGEAGRLWKMTLPSGDRELVAFRAQLRLDIREPAPPPRPALTAGRSGPPRSIVSPRLSPDGRTLVFVALGYLWQQPLDGAPAPSSTGPAQRLFEGAAFEDWPTFSPDGQQLAFVHSEHGKPEIRVFDFETRQTRTVASGWWQPSWSRDGQRLVFGEIEYPTVRVVTVNLSDGTPERVTENRYWSPRPHFSADGQSLYYSANTTGTGTLYRLPLTAQAQPEPMTQLSRHLSDALVSPDGKWLAFRRNTEIWVAVLGDTPVTEEDVHQLSPEGGDTFAFTPDSSGVIYAAGNRVWRSPVAGGAPDEIPIRLDLQRPTPPPLLVRRVRVLVFPPTAGPARADAAGGFGPETSLLIEQGRIRWIGSERGRQLPRETVILDAGGRFAIPGLFDLHVHTWLHGARVNQRAFLAYGVTSVRQPGSALTWLNTLAGRSETTSDPVPRYFLSSEYFEGKVPSGGDFALLISNENDARTYVRRWKERGAQFIKVYPTLSWPLQRAVAEQASQLGLPVAGHGTSAEEVIRSVILGYAFLEHPMRLYDDVLQMLALAGTRWDPTLSVAGGSQLLLRDEPERLEDEKFRAFVPESCLGKDIGAGSAMDTISMRGEQVEIRASLRAAHRLGVKLQAGTDAQWCDYGFSLLWELEHFVEAGLPPVEVLRIATQQAAEALGAEDDLGTLEPGKLADIVLLDENPLDDIRNTQSIWWVMKGVWVFDPDELRPPAASAEN